MDVIQKVKLTRFQMSAECLSANSTIVNSLPGFTANMTTVTSNLALIQTNAKLQEYSKTGISVNKGGIKKSVAMQAYDIGSKLVVFANNTGNAVLLDEISYSKTELEQSSDLDLKSRALCIHDRANSNITALSTYGITAAILTAFLTAINNFGAAIPKPTQGIKERKQITDLLKTLFKSTEQAFRNIDKIVEMVRFTQPAFYKNYKEARKLPVQNNSKVSLKGIVKDSASNEYLRGVALVITQTEVMHVNGSVNGKSPEIMKKTADKGGFVVKSLAAGVYQIKVSKAGYIDQIVSFVVNDCEMTSLEIGLSKA